MDRNEKFAMAFFIAMAMAVILIFSAAIVFAEERGEDGRYNLRYRPDYSYSKENNREEKKDSTFTQIIQPEKLFLGLSYKTWRKASYCAGGAAMGYGVKSGNKTLIGGGAVIFGITVYYDSDKSIADQFSWGDAGMAILCGAVGYYAGPSKKEPQSSPPPSSNPPPQNNPPPSLNPGPDPVLGDGSSNGSGSGSDPKL